VTLDSCIFKVNKKLVERFLKVVTASYLLEIELFSDLLKVRNYSPTFSYYVENYILFEKLEILENSKDLLNKKLIFNMEPLLKVLSGLKLERVLIKINEEKLEILDEENKLSLISLDFLEKSFKSVKLLPLDNYLKIKEKDFTFFYKLLRVINSKMKFSLFKNKVEFKAVSLDKTLSNEFSFENNENYEIKNFSDEDVSVLMETSVYFEIFLALMQNNELEFNFNKKYLIVNFKNESFFGKSLFTAEYI